MVRNSGSATLAVPRPSAHPGIVLGAILALSLGYALTFFPGLEWHGGYFGRSYQALHPESFPGDPYMRPNNVTNLSSYYALVRLVGDLWLDDRFTMAVYFLLVMLALIGVDKTAQLFGVQGLAGRVAVLSLMAVPHRFRSALPEVVTWADFYAGSFAGMVIVWLFYLVLSGARLWRIVTCVLLLWSLNVKWAWFPTVMAMTVVFRERLTPRQQRLTLLLLVLAAEALYLVYVSWIRPPGQEHVWLFDLLRQEENREANPFQDSLLANLKYFFLIGVGMWIRPPSTTQARRVRTFAVLGALLWLLGGLYLTYAPDMLKIPYLVPLAFNRATQGPIYLLLLSIGAGALIRMGAISAQLRTRFGALVLLGTLYATFGPSRMVKIGLLWGLVALVWFLVMHAMKGRAAPRVTAPRLIRQLVGGKLVPISSTALVLATMLMFGRAVIKRLPALTYLARHGVMGDNPSAKWVGVNEYIRRETPPDAMILPIATSSYPWRRGLTYDSSLRTRTGRLTPAGPEYSVLFNYDQLRRLHVENSHVQRLMAAWSARDRRMVEEGLAHFDVDYLVVENSEAEWIKGGLGTYRTETVIREFTIFRGDR